MNFHYVRADEAVSAFGGAAFADTDATYEDSWICDMRAGRPLRVTSVNLSGAITPLTPGEVGLIGVLNHNLDAETDVTFGGDISAVVTTGEGPDPDGIPFGAWTEITPVMGVDNVTVAITGNSVAIVIGEIIFGKKRSLPRPPYPNDSGGDVDFSRPPDMDLASIPGYDTPLAARTLSWTCLFTTAQLYEAQLIWRAQRNKTRPTLLVPDILRADAWCCFLERPQYSIHEPGLWDVELNFTEVPRVRW